MQKPQRILVFHTAFVGDIILTLPLVQVVREWAPASYIGFVAIPEVAPVLSDHPAVSEIITYDKRNRDTGLRGIFLLAKVLRTARYDVAVVPHRSLRSALVVWLARIPMRIGFDRSAGRTLFTDTIPYVPGIHEVDRNLRLLEPLGIQGSGRVLPTLNPGRADRDVIEQMLVRHRLSHSRFDPEALVAIAPGSVWKTKRWLKENFAALCRLLTAEGYSIALVGGADDAALCRGMEEEMGDEKVLNAAGMLTLLQSAELLRRCRVAVTNDSAPMHLAVAVRTPVVAIFGATVPQFGFGPLGPQDVVVETPGLSCRPCSIHGGDVCPIRTFVCMKDITPAEVFEKVQSVASRVSIRT